MGDLRTIIANSTDQHSLRIVFAGFAEPFSVRHIRELLQTCEDDPRVHRITVYTTGEGLSMDDLQFMAKLRKLFPDNEIAGNRYINFHVRPRSDYALMRGASGGIWKMIPQIARLFPSARFVFVSAGTSQKCFEAMRHELSHYGLQLTIRALVSRAGNVRHVNGRSLEKKRLHHPVSCGKVKPKTRMPVVVPDGSVYACCNDYGLELPIGNLITATWEELDFSHVRACQSDPNSNIPCFRGCHLAEAQPIGSSPSPKLGPSPFWEARVAKRESNKAG